MQNNDKNEVLTVENRKKITLSCVQTVDSFSDKVLKTTVNGKTLTISGKNIKITAFNETTGVLSAIGEFDEIKYESAKVPLFKRVFK